MSSDRAKQIALLLQAIIDLDRERADWLRDWKERREVFVNEVNILRSNILSGQMELQTEPTVIDMETLRGSDATA